MGSQKLQANELGLLTIRDQKLYWGVLQQVQVQMLVQVEDGELGRVTGSGRT